MPIISYTTRTNRSNNSTRRKTGRSWAHRALFSFGILTLLIHLPYSAFSQSRDTLIHKLDSHYYYPAQLGLKKLTAKVKWLQKDLSASRSKFISHPDVLFSWDAQSDLRVFQVDPRLSGLSETQKKEIEDFFTNYREVILPRTLGRTLLGFKSDQVDKAFFKATVKYQSPYKHEEIQSYSLDINAVDWRISKINIERKSPPRDVASHFKYIQKEGKWLVAETLARFDLGTDSYSERTSYTYQKVTGFWLPVKITQVFKKRQDVMHSYQFLLSDFQIN